MGSGPRNLRMSRLHLWRQPTARFGDDFQAALDEPSFPYVGLQRGQGHVRHLRLDQGDGLDHVHQAGDVGLRHASEDPTRRGLYLGPQHWVKAAPRHDIGATPEDPAGGLLDRYQGE